MSGVCGRGPCQEERWDTENRVMQELFGEVLLELNVELLGPLHTQNDGQTVQWAYIQGPTILIYGIVDLSQTN